MKGRGDILRFAVTASVLLSLACNRAQNTPSPQSASATKPAPQASQAPPAPSARPTVPSNQSPVSVSVSTVPLASAPASEKPASKMTASDHSQTLVVAQHTFRLLTHVQTIDGTNDQTVEWWELRDASDHVLYRQTYGIAIENDSFAETTSISASALNTSQGGGILIHGYDLPSAPGSGGWVQLFGFRYGRDKYGVDSSLFGSFGPPIMVDGEFLDIGTDPARTPPPVPSGVTVTVMHDVLKFRLWTGNFNIVYPVLINWITGRLEPAWRCLESTSKGTVNRCSYAISVDEAARQDKPTFVRLFPEPDDGFKPNHVIVQPQSKIEYLEARVPVGWNQNAGSIYFSFDGDKWLKVRIDGQEGWIHAQEDFDAVGLPESG